MTTLYLVRHGETYENKNHIFQGVMDSRLTPLGLRQADALGEFFADIHLDAAYTSPLSRARRTMTGVLAHHPEIKPVVRENLHEIKGGKLTGLTFDQCNERFDYIMMTFKSHPSAFAPPDGESIPEVYARFTKEMLTLAEANAGKSIVVVSHGTAIQTFLSYAKGLDADHVRFDFLPNGSVSAFTFDAGNHTIQTLYTGKLPK